MAGLALPGASAPERSGPHWCSRFPNSTNLGGLNPSFLPKVRDFIDALRDAEARVTISSGFRPAQRQYLMHWSWKIGRDGLWRETAAPCKSIKLQTRPEATWYYHVVPSYSGPHPGACEIIWARESDPVPIEIRNCTQGCETHHTTRIEAEDASRAMTETYGLVYRPSAASRHVDGRAIDMNISWSGDLTIEKKDGSSVTISSFPKNGNNVELHDVGATYGVYKLVNDPPHWSDDGR